MGSCPMQRLLLPETAVCQGRSRDGMSSDASNMLATAAQGDQMASRAGPVSIRQATPL